MSIVSYSCQCGYEYNDSGYDDSYFHEEIVPNMICKKCLKNEYDYTNNIEILKPKYQSHEVI